MTWLAGTWAVMTYLLASAIWATPAFVAHHTMMRRHMERQHDETRRQIAMLGSSGTEEA